jgi:cyclophilin family peptidyl-prolyl cis-trans isomerase/HEAT repeat protein
LAIVGVLFSAFSSAQETLRERMIAVEDARAPTDSELATLRQGLTSRDPKLRQQAVRAIGRLERPELMPTLTRPLADDDIEVRIEAANAIGQLARGPQGIADAKSRLLARARAEKDPRAWGAIAATLGRLQYTAAADVDEVEATLARLLPSAGTSAVQIDALLGAVEGLEALARQSGKIAKLKPATLNGLRVAAGLEGRLQVAEKLTRIRRLATLALTSAGGVTRPALEFGAADPDDEIRRLMMIAARTDIDGRDAVIAKGLADSNARVRYEALQTWARLSQKTSCEAVVRGVGDSNAHVALLAVDLLGNGCPGDAATLTTTLQRLAAGLTTDARTWHRPAHALVSLARVAPTVAREILPRFVAHATWQVRMYAARAAGTLGEVADLERLARDAHHNVREAAIGALTTLKRPEAFPLALEALNATDYQLLMTASRALVTSSDPAAAVQALEKAFARVAAERRDTSRDAQNAIREAVKQLGGPALPEFKAQPITPTPLAAGQLDTLARTRLRFTMAGLGTFDLRLLPNEAAVTAAHVAALARQGYYNGLTFHRVAPNFVIQGGGPGANEYSGQGPFMRDEVGLASHRRGTVGISTRGRDTGDAQIFINLVDSPRLDHLYTVFAEVTAGMEVVDAVLEGDVITRVDVLPPG